MPIDKDPERTEIDRLEIENAFHDQRVLEIGCGDGRLTWRYAPIAGRVTGIDPDMDALRSAAGACPLALQKTISFIRANSIVLPFKKANFDISILAWSL